jgi:Rha family phage regulatory protein
MADLVKATAIVAVRRDCRAIYAVDFFERKRVPSYSLWALKIKGHNNRYPKIPTAYGRCATLEEAHLALTEAMVKHGVSVQTSRQDIVSWNLVKELISGGSGAVHFARAIKRRHGKEVVAIQASSQTNELVLLAKNKTAKTTSVIVAQKFGKRHDNVLRDIAKLECSAEFRLLNFEESSYINEQGKEQPMFEMTWKGFSMLAMGFTGAKAVAWKEKFLDAFEAMGEEITRLSIQKHDAVWQQARLSGKVARIELTDAVQEFVEYAHAQGSTNARRYYTSITLMEYRALFLIGKAVGEGFRDKLTAFQSSYLTTAESIAQRALREGMTKELHYKGIYTLAKDRVEQFAAMIGKSHPGDGHLALEAA